jgi:hypothetical protein
LERIEMKHASPEFNHFKHNLAKTFLMEARKRLDKFLNNDLVTMSMLFHPRVDWTQSILKDKRISAIVSVI